MRRPSPHVLGAEAGGRVVADLYQLAVAGACCLADGALAAALALTTAHVRIPGAVRPAAGHVPGGRPADRRRRTSRAAPCTWPRCRPAGGWTTGREAGGDLDVAAYWLAEQAPAALRTCHHLHGGIGMDVTLPAAPLLRRWSRTWSGSSAAPTTGSTCSAPGSAAEGPPCSSTSPTPSCALRDELRAYFAGLISPGERAAMLTERHGAVYREVVRRMGRDGWLGVGWPAEYGGRGLGQVEQQIFANEAARADVPLPAVTLQTVGPTLQAHGTPEQKDFFLPADPGRRGAFRDRVHRAGGGHRPGGAADQGGAGPETHTWSTARRCSPPAPTTPTTSGWPAAPPPTRPGTRGFPSSSSTPPIPASPGPRSSRTTGRTTSTRPTTPTCASRSPCGSGRRTPAGGW